MPNLTHTRHLPAINWPGWHLIGSYPDGDPDDVGSWVLSHGGEAMLLEVPPGLTVKDVKAALRRTGAELRYVTASHEHEDHFDAEAWELLRKAFPLAQFIHPAFTFNDKLLHLGCEPLWLIRAPKHSLTDVVTVFRGRAMTGDIELETLDSVNDEVRVGAKRRSMAYLGDFQDRTGYHVHSIISAHLNDIREGVDWPSLFTVGGGE